MSEPTRDPIHDLEAFGTGGHVMTPLAPNEVRRLGDRRRTHRRTAAVLAASVVAAAAVAVPVALTRGGDPDGHGNIAHTSTPTPTTTSTPTVTTYPGTGVEVKSAADVDKLTGTSPDFRSFIVDQLDKITGPDHCAVIHVQKYSSAGYALGDVGSCGGYAALWVKLDGNWQEGMGTQDTWDCTTLNYLGVPRSFVGDCGNEAGGFGPDEVSGLRLGMTQAQVEAAGGALDPGLADACRGLLLPYQSRVPDHADGWFSPAKNLVAIAARPGMKTPERIGLGSSRADVEAAYPRGSLQNGYWVVPLGGGIEYEIGLEATGTVGELMLTDSQQDCFG
jgi:hypothetical protein